MSIEWSLNGNPLPGPEPPFDFADFFVKPASAWVGDELTATFYLENIGGTIGAYTIGVEWDASELSPLGSTEFLPTPEYININAGTGNAGLCSGLLYEALLPTGTLASGRFAIGEAVFEVVALVDDSQPDVTTAPCAPDSIYSTTDVSSDVTSQTLFLKGAVRPPPPTQHYAIFGNPNGTEWSWRIEFLTGTVAAATHVGPILPPPFGSTKFFVTAFEATIDATTSSSGCSATREAATRFRIDCPQAFAFFVGDDVGTPANECKVSGTLGGTGCPFNPTIVETVPSVPTLGGWPLLCLGGALVAGVLAYARSQHRALRSR